MKLLGEELQRYVLNQIEMFPQSFVVVPSPILQYNKKKQYFKVYTILSHLVWLEDSKSVIFLQILYNKTLKKKSARQHLLKINGGKPELSLLIESWHLLSELSQDRLFFRKVKSSQLKHADIFPFNSFHQSFLKTHTRTPPLFIPSPYILS